MNLRPGRISFQDLGSRKDKDFLVEYAPMLGGREVEVTKERWLVSLRDLCQDSPNYDI